VGLAGLDGGGLRGREVLLGLSDLGDVGVAAFGGFQAATDGVQGGLVPVAFFFGLAGGFPPALEGAASGGFLLQPVPGGALLGGEILPLGVDAF
jgi:hypothetical protein